MAKCSGCGTFILWGGITQGGMRFCGPGCLTQSVTAVDPELLSDDAVRDFVEEIRSQPCPQCHGAGPVDVHTSHWIFSVLVFTRWSSSPRICCRSCGVRSQAGGLFASLALGWWGFPWGFVMTPVQIGRNVAGLLSSRGRDGPSEELYKHARLMLATHVAAQIESKKCPTCGGEVTVQDSLESKVCPTCGVIT